MSLSAIFLILMVFLCGANFAQGENDSCSMVERLHGEIVNIKKAKENAEKNNGTVSVPKALTVNSSEECEQGCCGNVNCTVYLFYPRPPSNDGHIKFNCFFLNCRPQNLCALINVSNKAEGAVVGIRELRGNAVEAMVTANLASVPTSIVQPAYDQKETSTSKPPVTSENSTEPKTIEQPEASTTSVPLKITKNKGDNNHTTSGSLIIALAFGILFFLAVMVLIGRPWWNSFHRPRYSKVDYLMNGL